MQGFERTKLTVVLLGIAQVVLGVIFFMNPAGATVTLVRIVGWLLIFVGGVTIGSGLMRNDASASDYIIGGLELALGVIMVIRPAFFVTYLFIVIGILVLMTGVGDLLNVGSVQPNGRQVSFGMAILTLVAGVIMLVAPFFFADMMVMIAGCALVVSGVTEVISGLQMP
jgi:uncharacterized membrane protein HdeD (DUF308 family)